MDESKDSNESTDEVLDDSSNTNEAQSENEQENQKNGQNNKKKVSKKEIDVIKETEDARASTIPTEDLKPAPPKPESLGEPEEEKELMLEISDHDEEVQNESEQESEQELESEEELKQESEPESESQSEQISQSVKSYTEDESLSFLELDTETREKMLEIEEEELKKEEEERLAKEEAEFKESGIFAIKTSIGHEKMVANWLAIRARKRKLEVYAILSPPKLRGYLLLEGVKNKEALQDLIKGVQHARSVVDGTSSLDEIEHFLTPKPLVSGIEEGDVVEIIAGPFKGEKAKVTQIDESKEEITVELFEAMVSIPVTIRGDHVRILEKETK